MSFHTFVVVGLVNTEIVMSFIKLPFYKQTGYCQQMSTGVKFALDLALWKSQCNKTMKLSQAIEYNMKKHTQNFTKQLFPDSFLK